MQEQSVEQKAAEVEKAVAAAIAAHEEVDAAQGVAEAWAYAHPEPVEQDSYADAGDMAEAAFYREVWREEFNALRSDINDAKTRATAADGELAGMVLELCRSKGPVSFGATDADGEAVVVSVYTPNHVEIAPAEVAPAL